VWSFRTNDTASSAVLCKHRDGVYPLERSILCGRYCVCRRSLSDRMVCARLCGIIPNSAEGPRASGHRDPNRFRAFALQSPRRRKCGRRTILARKNATASSRKRSMRSLYKTIRICVLCYPSTSMINVNAASAVCILNSSRGVRRLRTMDILHLITESSV